MGKPRFLAAMLLSAALAIVLFCGNPKNPYSSPSAAKIFADSSLTSLNDSVKAFTEVPCSVSLYLPGLIDSMYVHVVKTGYDTVIAGVAVKTDKVAFDFVAPAPGTYQVKVFIVRSDNSFDSLIKEVKVFLILPVVTTDSASFHITLPRDSFVVRFIASDADSNLRFGYTWVDTGIGTASSTPFLSLKPFHETFSRTVSSAALLSGLGAPIVLHAYAIDAESLFSAVTSCTLFVSDTTKPSLKLLAPDTAATVTSLPVTVRALVTDLAGINTVTFNGAAMVFANDTASYEASSIDSGKSLDSIVAFDKAGNRAAMVFPLTYSGKKLYPPKIIDLSRSTPEGHSFAPISLDASVILSDTGIKDTAGYKKDSLTWLITDSVGNQIAVPASHLFTVPFPSDTEWAGTIRLTFRVTAKNNPALYDTKQPSFFVTEVYDPPVITQQQDLCSTTPHSATIYLDTITTVRALDNKYPDLDWTFKNGKHFKVDSLYGSILSLGKTAAPPVTTPGGAVIVPPITRFYFNRHVVISPITVPDSGYYGTDTLLFTVTSPQGSIVSKPIYFSHSKLCLFHLFP